MLESFDNNFKHSAENIICQNQINFAKTAAIKNIQKALTARILKRLDDGQPLVEVARKMKAIEGMQP